MRRLSWPRALGIDAALGLVAGLAFLILTGTETLGPDHATAFWILSLVVFVIPFGSCTRGSMRTRSAAT